MEPLAVAFECFEETSDRRALLLSDLALLDAAMSHDGERGRRAMATKDF